MGKLGEIFLIFIVVAVVGAMSQLRTRLELRELINDDGSAKQGLQDYIDGYKCLMNKAGGIKNGASVWDEFAKVHSDLGHLNHGYSRFLPWHRLFLLALEDAMTKCLGRQVTVPYWNSAIEGASEGGLRDSPIYNHFGRRSGCVSGHNVAYPKPHCLQRQFTDEYTIATREQVQRFLETSKFEDMVTGLEGFVHGTVHVMVGGDMGDMHSPNDPIFYMHHANVDRLWHNWQNLKNKNLDTYGGHNPATKMASSLHDIMDIGVVQEYVGNMKVQDLLNIGELGYMYSAGPTPVYDTDPEPETTTEPPTTTTKKPKQTTKEPKTTKEPETTTPVAVYPEDDDEEVVVDDPKDREERIKYHLKKWHTAGRHPTWVKAKLAKLGDLPESWVKMNHLNTDILEKRKEKVNRFTDWLNELEGLYPRHIDNHVVRWISRNTVEGKKKDIKLRDVVRAYKLEKSGVVKEPSPYCGQEAGEVTVKLVPEDCTEDIELQIAALERICDGLENVLRKKGMKVPNYDKCDKKEEEEEEEDSTTNNNEVTTGSSGTTNNNGGTTNNNGGTTNNNGGTTNNNGGTTAPSDESTTNNNEGTTNNNGGTTNNNREGTTNNNGGTTSPSDEGTTNNNGGTTNNNGGTTNNNNGGTTAPEDDDDETTAPEDEEDDDNTTTPDEDDDDETPPAQDDRSDDEEDSSSAAVAVASSNAVTIAAVVVGAAVAAGIAALAIGLLVNASAAGGASAASGAPMAAANTNPLYTPFTNQGENAAFN